MFIQIIIVTLLLIKKKSIVIMYAILFVDIIVIVLSTDFIVLENFFSEYSAILWRFVLVHNCVDSLDGHIFVRMHLLEPVVRLVMNE